VRDSLRRAALVAVPVALVAACALTAAFRHVELRTSLYDLVGDAAEVIPQAVRGRSSNVVPVIFSSADFSSARAAAERLVGEIPDGFCESVRLRVDGEELAAVLDMCRRRRAGLASARDAELLATPEGRARIARNAARRYFSSPVPPLFPPAEDPFCLADGFVASLPQTASGWRPREGVLCAERGGMSHVLVVLVLKKDVADDADALIDFGEKLGIVLKKVGAADEGVVCRACGVPMHTAAAAGRCKAETGALTVFSLFVIAALSLFAFRSARWLPLLAASLVVAAGAGATAVVAAFRSVHVMSIVFSTSVLGLVVDYSFHWLMQSGDRRGETIRNLLVSFATTEISLLPLALSSLPVLRQAAVFLGAGLAAALAFAVLLYPAPSRACAAPVRRPLLGVAAKLCLAAVALAGIAGLFQLRFETDAQALYRPSGEIAAAERLFAEIGGATDAARGFLVTQGSGALEALLEREAEVRLPDDTPRLSRFMPPASARRGIAALVARLYEEHGERQRELLGLDALAPPDEPLEWRWEDVPPFAAGAFSGDGALVVPSCPPVDGDMPEGTSFVRPQVVLAEVLSNWMRETRARLGMALVLMLAALLAFCRTKAPAVMAPPLLAIAFAWGVISFAGEGINLFHLLASFLLAGMGVDYAVFLRFGGRDALKPAVCSLLTSMAGFGALAFVSFPAAKSFGVVLGIGLPGAFLASLALAPRGDASSETEHGASPLGLEILYFFYLVFGLGALHLGASCVGLCVWTFSAAVRRNSPSPRKVVMFARSLADKLVVMADGKRLPKVETDGSPDAEAFVADVASRRGVFVLSSHCGTVEVLAALGECPSKFHAWMEFERTSTFNSFYMRHARRGKVVIHPISGFGPETVFEAGDAIDSGDCLVMAGDRGFGRMRRVPFGEGEIELPEGAFRFAAALGHPVYFVACVATGACRYTAVVRRLASGADEMAHGYAAALRDVTRRFPDQWFSWGGQS